MNKEKFINQLDEFMYEFDPYEYADQQVYPGSNRDDISSLVENHKFRDIKDFLQEVIDDNRDPNCVMKAKKLLKQIKETSSIQR